MTASFDASFVEDNFFSDGDWARQPLDVSGLHNSKFDFTATELPRSFSDANTESALNEWTNTSKLSSTYMQHEHETNFIDNFSDLFSGLESPPITPPEKLNLIPMNTASHHMQASNFRNEHIDPVDELLTQLSCDHNAADQGECGIIVDGHSSKTRIRSSSNASSSTSAYSSQSSTPPPAGKNSTDFFDQAFTGENIEEGKDEGFHENTQNFQSGQYNFTAAATNQNFSQKLLPSRSRKSLHPKRVETTSVTEVANFDKAVEAALKETNRLLNMYEVRANPRESLCENEEDKRCNVTPSKPPVVDLGKLCDSMILQNDVLYSEIKKSNGVSDVLKGEEYYTPPSKCDLKRKAMDKQHQKTKKLLMSQCNISSVINGISSDSPNILVAENQQPQIIQNCQLPDRNLFQMPVSCIATPKPPPLKFIVKQEPTSSIYLTSPTASNPTVTLMQNQHNSLEVIPVSSGQTSITCSPAITILKQENAPNTIIIKPDTNLTSIPVSTINISTSQSTIKMVQTSSSNGCNPPKILPLVNKPVVESRVEVKTTTSKSACKPLMGSMTPITPIVPSYIPNTYSGLSLLNQTNSGTTNGHNLLGMLDKKPSEPTMVADIDIRVKRQQRMIKNRASACQSRQRKKEYVTTLEVKMNECLDDNNKLRTLNTQLKMKISELENENKTLRALASSSHLGQRKAAYVLMLVLFVGFNVNPLNLLANDRISSEPIMTSSDDNITEARAHNEPGEAGYHARQLLSVDGQNAVDEKLNVADLQLLQNEIRSKHTFWMDDMIKDYARKHFGRILDVAHGTRSVSLQRMLLRKLKEELGLHVRMPLSKTKRISYTPSQKQAHPTMSENFPPEDLAAFSDLETAVKVPPSSPVIKRSTSRVHEKPLPTFSPCEHLEPSLDQLNQTDSLRIKDNIAKWIEHHEIQQRKISEITKLNNEPQKISKRKRKASKNSSTPRHVRKRSSSLSSEGTGVALYEKRNRKLKQLLNAIERKNDTVYMISFSKDHILLPATMLNASGHTKMSLVLPAVAPNDSYTSDENHQTMIQINCEAISVEYLRVKRNLLPDSQEHAPSETRASSRAYHSAENPKLQAYKGSDLSRRRKFKSSTSSQDDDATVSDVIDL